MFKNCISLVTLLALLLLWAMQHCLASDKQSKVERLGILKTDAGAGYDNGGNGRFQLSSGTVLLEARQALDVQMDKCSIQTPAGAALLMTLKNEIGCVTNLCEKGSSSVRVRFGDCSLKLAAGRQAWFGPNEAAVAQAVKEEPGRPSLVRQHQNASGVIAEFSLSPATLLDSSSIVETMKESANPEERKLYNRIIKTSAALTMTH